ncbi:MAG: acyltransferase [Clostridia bacterium]|nr:acyltransferase [Clostridia bacterium]
MAKKSLLTERESVAINILKAISIFSVIAAHVIVFTDDNLFSRIISSLWILFGEIGVISFFVIGGFLYARKPLDGKAFWQKKFFRIIIPWLMCSSLTHLFFAFTSHTFSIVEYLKWVFGSGTWYYYIAIYTLFLFIFKWLWNRTAILIILIGLQVISLLLASFGFSLTPPLPFMTDYLNPLHWVGYFSLGILVRTYRLDIRLRAKKSILFAAYLLSPLTALLLMQLKIFTYFNILTSVFCLSSLIIIADLSYRIAVGSAAKSIAKIGTWSYCIYLLHMQIVQFFINRLPGDWFRLLFSPIVGLALMVLFICIGLFLCKKLPFGEKIKLLVGL